MKKIFKVLLLIISILFITACQPQSDDIKGKEDIKITFMLEGNAYSEMFIEYDTKITAPMDPTKENETFDDWYTNTNYTQTFNFNLSLKEDTHIYGRYKSKSVVDPNKETTLNIYYVNDIHGSILKSDSSIGLSYMANVIMDEKESNPDTTIFLGGGDLLQGQIISNYYDGASAIDIFNDMQMDAFVMGNHEFDWGLEEVTQYFNGKNDLQANYPLLGANIYNKSNDKMHEDLKAYTILEKAGLRIAVIGVIGSGLESSISFTRIEPYYFTNPVTKVKELTKHVRENENADVVLVVNHDDNNSFNSQVSSFTGNERVDAIFNGHSHSNYAEFTNGKPLIQSGGNGSHLGNVKLTYSKNGGITNPSVKNLTPYNEEKLNEENLQIKEKIEMYNDEISHLYETILTSDNSYDKNQVGDYIAKLMLLRTDSDIAIHNYGGTRADISRGENISYSKLFQISPFDNTVVTVEVYGRDLDGLLRNNAVSYKSGLSRNNLQSNKLYKVATNDYIFGGSNTLKAGSNIKYTGETLLDVFVSVVENQKESGFKTWSMSNTISFSSAVSYHFSEIKDINKYLLM